MSTLWTGPASPRPPAPSEPAAGPASAGLAGEPLPAATALEVLDALDPAAVPDVFPVPLLAVDLERSRPDDLRELAARRPALVLVGVADGNRPSAPGGAERLDVVLPEVADAAGSLADLITAVRANPIAAVTLCGLLRTSAGLPALDALVAESLAYSTLLAGPEFARWRATSPSRAYRPSPEPVLVRREGRRLRLLINRPEVRNAYDTATRDALVAALRAARADSGIDDISLEAVGVAFGAGGDLGQFGTTPDPATAHLIRIGCAAGAEIVRGGPPVTAYLHGACVGAGIEVPAFAGRVVATPDTFAALPELAMGLVPGAGGTVSLTRRMGRRRTAWLVLSGARLPAVTAQRWGLVDTIVEQVPRGEQTAAPAG
ncbi:MAG: enoyl-CoA hydratase/isomerase family protein [Frankia sp.]